MKAIPLGIATTCYVATALELYFAGNKPLALTFAAYAAANIGLMWAAY